MGSLRAGITVMSRGPSSMMMIKREKGTLLKAKYICNPRTGRLNLRRRKQIRKVERQSKREMRSGSYATVLTVSLLASLAMAIMGVSLVYSRSEVPTFLMPVKGLLSNPVVEALIDKGSLLFAPSTGEAKLNDGRSVPEDIVPLGSSTSELVLSETNGRKGENGIPEIGSHEISLRGITLSHPSLPESGFSPNNLLGANEELETNIGSVRGRSFEGGEGYEEIVIALVGGSRKTFLEFDPAPSGLVKAIADDGSVPSESVPYDVPNPIFGFIGGANEDYRTFVSYDNRFALKKSEPLIGSFDGGFQWWNYPFHQWTESDSESGEKGIYLLSSSISAVESEKELLYPAWSYLDFVFGDETTFVGVTETSSSLTSDNRSALTAVGLNAQESGAGMMVMTSNARSSSVGALTVDNTRHVDPLYALLEFGTDVAVKEDGNDTILMIVEWNNLADPVRSLLDFDPDAVMKNNQKAAAMTYAMDEDHIQDLEELFNDEAALIVNHFDDNELP